MSFHACEARKLLLCGFFLLGALQADPVWSAFDAQSERSSAEEGSLPQQADAALSIMRCRGEHARVKNANGDSEWIALSELRVVRADESADQVVESATQQPLQQCQTELAETREQLLMNKHAEPSSVATSPFQPLLKPGLVLSLALVLVGVLLGLIIASLRGARL